MAPTVEEGARERVIVSIGLASWSSKLCARVAFEEVEAEVHDGSTSG